MNAPSRIRPRSDGLVTADASRVSASDFVALSMDRFRPRPTRIADRAAATNDYLEAMFTASKAEAGDAEYHRIRSEYAAALKAIDAKWRKA